ncbi:MAG: glycosyltransferase, partial [Lachnospiraceae bacterium]|nr:glycosyltransferase [Lachnospiraceae bacterium]
MVKVSVIMPVYNEEKYIREALESFEKQTLKEKELICIDDGSKDKSIDII